MDAIAADDLVKTYPGGVRALDGLSFTVPESTIFGLLGPNGAGKTTAVKILTTLARPDTGTAHVAGFDILREAPAVGLHHRARVDRRRKRSERLGRGRPDRGRVAARRGDRSADGGMVGTRAALLVVLCAACLALSTAAFRAYQRTV